MAKYTKNNVSEDINRLIGARVMFKSLPINLLRAVKNYYKEQFTIKKIHVKVNETGSNKILIELEEIPGVLINHNLLELVDYIPGVSDGLSAICGNFLCCQVLCGKDVSGGNGSSGEDNCIEYEEIIVEDLSSLSSIIKSITKND